MQFSRPRLFGKVNLFILVLFSFSAHSSCDAENYFVSGREARIQGNWALAEEKLTLARECQPENSDIYVQLGSTLFAQAKLAESRAMYEQALRLAPDYTDAKYGLVQVALADDDLDYAESLLNQYRQQDKNDPEFEKLAARLQAIRDAVRNWRLDMHGSHSELSDNYVDWNDFDFALTRKISEKTSLTANYSYSRRFNIDDQKIGATVWHTVNDRFYGYAQGLISPQERFFPGYTIATGGYWLAALPYSETIGSLNLNYDIKFEHYENGGVTTLSPGVEQFFFADRFSLSAKWLNTFDQNDKHNGGYMVRAKVAPRHDFSMHLGYSDALETSDRLLIRTKAVFTGLTYQVNDDIALHADYTVEDRRKAYDRDIFGVGLTWLF